MHTLTGRRFDLGGDWNITVRDVAVGLSRIPRWAGATLVPWSVLQHSIAVYERVRYVFPGLHAAQLAALWHDVEEFATGDIPKPFKHAEQSKLGEQIRRWMWDSALRLPHYDDDQEIVKHFDEEARLVEVNTICHPRIRSDFERHPVSPEVFLDACDVFWNLYDVPVREMIERFESETRALKQRIERESRPDCGDGYCCA